MQREKIGQGTYGTVYREVRGGQTYAVKHFHNLLGKDLAHPILRELTIIQLLQHPNLIRMMEIRANGGDIELVMEYGGMNMRKYCTKVSAEQRAEEVQTVAYQLLSALRYLFAVRCVHRDLKPDNILISKADGLLIKICDLGLSKILTPGTEGVNSPRVCTLNYRPPENSLSKAENYTHAVDIWGTGCVLYEFVTGSLLFPGRIELAVLQKILQTVPVSAEDHVAMKLPIPLESCNREPFFKIPAMYDYTMTNSKLTERMDQCQNLIEMMLAVNPARRINAKEAMGHKLFRGMKVPEIRNQLRMSARHPPDPHYLDAETRTKYVKYIIDFTESQMLQKQTVLLSISNFDRSICALKPPKTKLGLLTAAIIYMCSKYVDIATVNRGLFTKKYSEKDLYEAEREVIQSIGFVCHRATLLDLYREIRGPGMVSEGAWNIMKLMVMDYENFRDKGTEEIRKNLETRLLEIEPAKSSDDSSGKIGSRIDG